MLLYKAAVANEKKMVRETMFYLLRGSNGHNTLP